MTPDRQTARLHVRHTVSCPTCEAEPGVACKLNGRDTRFLHAARWKVFAGGLLKTSLERNAMVLIGRKHRAARLPGGAGTEILAGWDNAPAGLRSKLGDIKTKYAKGGRK